MMFKYQLEGADHKTTLVHWLFMKRANDPHKISGNTNRAQDVRMPKTDSTSRTRQTVLEYLVIIHQGMFIQLV